MRIAILSDGIPPESTGGAETIAWSLAQGLRSAGHEVHLITATPGRSFEEPRGGIATYHLHSAQPARWKQYTGLYNPATIGPLRALLTRLRPDLVNAHNVQNELSWFSLVVAHRLGIPTVWNSHDLSAIMVGRMAHFVDPTDLNPRPLVDYHLPALHDLRRMRLRWNPLRVPLVRSIVSASADVRVSVSQAHAAALTANGIPALQVVHNGIDLARFSAVDPASVDALRRRFGLVDRPVVLFAGRLRREKGSTQLVEALDILASRVRDVALLVLADRGFKRGGRLQRKFPAVFEKHVVESGWLQGDELVAAYHLADVVTTPSVYLDPFPTVNLEAMAAGRPLVTTCFGGSPEAIADGQTGYVINPFDTASLAGRLEALLLDENLRRSLGEAGSRRAQENFSLERYVSAMLEIYQAARPPRTAG